METDAGAGRERLLDVLSRTMLRTSKAGVRARLLPRCTKTTVRLPFERAHQECYNTLIDVRPTVKAC